MSTTLKLKFRNQKKFNDSIDHDKLNKKIRSKNLYDEIFYAKCQQNFEIEIFDLLKKFQITIVKFQKQKKNFVISILILLINVEIYQNIVETIFRNFLNVDFQKSINYKKIMIFFQQND